MPAKETRIFLKRVYQRFIVRKSMLKKIYIMSLFTNLGNRKYSQNRTWKSANLRLVNHCVHILLQHAYFTAIYIVLLVASPTAQYVTLIVMEQCNPIKQELAHSLHKSATSSMNQCTKWEMD
jgi:hypothetical protein